MKNFQDLTGDFPQNPDRIKLKSREFRTKDMQNMLQPESKQKKSFVFPQNTGAKANPKLKKTEFLRTIWNFFQFILISTIVFAIIFISFNWESYSQIIISKIDPQAGQTQEIALNKSIIEPQKAQNLLKISKQQKEVKKEFPPLDLKIISPDNRIIIPKLGKNIPIIEINNQQFNTIEKLTGKEFEGAVQEGLQNGVIHYPGTAQPGQYGNFFVTGHSSYYFWDPGRYKDVFALLHSLEIGDTYYVYFNQKKYTYTVYNKYEVTPSDISVLDQPTDRKESTIMTCTPVGTDLRRLIIKAEQV
jgi:LPXTG-site transpeptidase (sortase) family protein